MLEKKKLYSSWTIVPRGGFYREANAA